jgi:hypothetical protein
MKMTKSFKPELIQLFENLLWAHSPKNWILKSTYFQDTLFISMIVMTYDEEIHQKIYRNFGLDIIKNRAFDIWGFATDCVDEMKTEIN